MSTKQNLTIEQGATFLRIVRWEVPPIVYRPITAIVNGAPATVTCPAHGLKDGWRAAITSAKGMWQINAKNTPPRQSDYHRVTVIDTNTIAFNDINASGFNAYLSGGVLQYNTPVDLTGYTARMSIKNRIGGTELLRLTTENGDIVLDPVGNTITLSISAVTTASFSWNSGVYDLEMVSSNGAITTLLHGAVSVQKAVTT